MSEPQETFLVDYPCDRHCQVEIDLTEVHTKFTIRQARSLAEAEHRERHEPLVESTPVHDMLTASFRSAG